MASAAFLLSLAVPPGALAERVVVRRLDLGGIPLEVRHARDAMPRGRYLVTLNDVPRVIENTPPYRAVAFVLDTPDRPRVLREFRSTAGRIWAVDLKPQPDGLYSLALNRPRPPIWVNDLRLIEPFSGAEIIEPGGYPSRDPAFDGHEPLVHDGDRRLFLFYRERKEGETGYIDMEIAALSASRGTIVAHWSSRGRFPASMSGDYLHFNSLHPLPGGRVLASARATSTLYVINLDSGAIEEEISALKWKVVDDPLRGFARQHFAHLLPNGNLMLFDNRDASEPAGRSRAVEYEVDWPARTLRMVWQRPADPEMAFRYGWGSAAAVGDDQVLIGWGDYPRARGYCDGRTGMFPVFSHVTRAGRMLFELRAPCGWATYRVYFVPSTPAAHRHTMRSDTRPRRPAPRQGRD